MLFKIIDYIASLFMGSGTAVLVAVTVGKGWNMFIAMMTGMALGIVVLIIAAVLFIFISSPFELLPAGMIITMFTGMFTAMAIVVLDVNLDHLLWASLGFSLIVQFSFDLYNLKVRGDVHIGGQREH